MKSVKIDPAIASDERLAAKVNRANDILAGVLNRSADLFDVEWGLSTDERGEKLLRVKIADSTDEASITFGIDELDDRLLLKSRMYGLYGEVLGLRSDRQSEVVDRLYQELVRQA